MPIRPGPRPGSSRRPGVTGPGSCAAAGSRPVAVDGDAVAGVDTDAGRIGSRVVVDAAGAWAGALARTAGVEVPIETWRHDTVFFGPPAGRTADVPIVIDELNAVYFRPEGRDLLLVGLEGGSEVGGSPDRPQDGPSPAVVEAMAERLCRRLPWMREGTFRSGHGGQDGITTADQRPILGRAGPDGFYLACGFSGTGFKTAPAIGRCLAELILDGRTTTADISGYSLDRFAAGRLARRRAPVRAALALSGSTRGAVGRRRLGTDGHDPDPRRHGPRHVRAGAALRGSRVRPSVVRLLGGRRSRVEGGPPVLAQGHGQGRDLRRDVQASPGQPVPGRSRGETAGRQPVRDRRAGQPVPDPRRGRRGGRPRRQPVRTEAPAQARRSRRAPRASCSCSGAVSASPGATPRSCSRTTRRRPTPSSGR